MKAAVAKVVYRNHNLLCFLTIFTVILTAHVASAGVWYEPFANPPYADNTRVGGNSVWGSGNSVGTSSVVVSNVANLSYTGLVTTESSGGLVCVTNISGSNRFAHTNAALSVVGGPIVPGPGTNIYLSFLINLQAIPASDRQVVGLSTAAPSTTTPASSVILGVNSSGQLMVGKTPATLNTYGATLGTALTAGTTYFVVMKYNWQLGSANDSVDIWLNPTPGSSETTPDASATTGGADLTAGIQSFAAYQAQGTGGGSVYGTSSGVIWIDEIRLGTNWDDVTPSAGCVAAQVTSGATPSSATVNIGGTANFSITAQGTARTYFWQESPNGSTWNPASGATDSPNYTTPALFSSDNGKQYRCVVSNFCDSPNTSVSSVATVAVQDLSVISYRSANSGGNWNNPGSWDQSTNGVNWTSATGTPSSANSNITIRVSHPITVTANVSADQLTVEANATLTAGGGILTIVDGPTAIDCNVLGTLTVADVAGSYVTNALGTAGITISSGGKFVWARSSDTIRIPIATWADGSTCEVQDGGNGVPANLNQSYYDFYWNKSSSGAVNLGAQLTTMRRNLTMKGSSDPANSVRFMGAAGTCDLGIGGNFTLESGYITLSGGSGAGTILNITVNSNMVISSGAIMDTRNSGGGSSANIYFTNTAGSHGLSLVDGTANIGHSGAGGGCPINWIVGVGATTVLTGGSLPLDMAGTNITTDSVTVDGTLSVNGNQLVGTNSGNLIVNAGGTLVGNGVNAVGATLNDVTVAGTLNINQSLPTFSGGETLPIFTATTYNLAGMTIIPGTPPGATSWDTTTTPGTLIVVGGGGPTPGNPRITSIVKVGTTVVVSGTNGTHSGTYYVMATNNVAAAKPWPSIQTNGFDAAGNFSFTNGIGSSPLFFIIQQQPLP